MGTQARRGPLPLVEAEAEDDHEARDERAEGRTNSPAVVSALRRADEEKAQSSAEKEVSDPVERLDLLSGREVALALGDGAGRREVEEGGDEECRPETGADVLV